MGHFRFDFAISYAGEEVGLAGDVYRLLTEKGARVFFALNDQVYLLGKSLKAEIPYKFGPETRFVVPIVSACYVEKQWTRIEFETARGEQTNRGFEVILPVRLDNVSLPGLEEDVVYIDLRKDGVMKAVEQLTTKLSEIVPAERGTPPTSWVITFGLNVAELVENNALPRTAPPDYPSVCDWLRDDLMERLSRTSLTSIDVLEEGRDGETLSLRVGFRWNPDAGPLDIGDLGWWEVLEYGEYDSIYSIGNEEP